MPILGPCCCWGPPAYDACRRVPLRWVMEERSAGRWRGRGMADTVGGTGGGDLGCLGRRGGLVEAGVELLLRHQGIAADTGSERALAEFMMPAGAGLAPEKKFVWRLGWGETVAVGGLGERGDPASGMKGYGGTGRAGWLWRDTPPAETCCSRGGRLASGPFGSRPAVLVLVPASRLWRGVVQIGTMFAVAWRLRQAGPRVGTGHVVIQSGFRSCRVASVSTYPLRWGRGRRLRTGFGRERYRPTAHRRVQSWGEG